MKKSKLKSSLTEKNSFLNVEPYYFKRDYDKYMINVIFKSDIV